MYPTDSTSADRFLRTVAARNPGEPEFHQAVRETVESLIPVFDRHHRYFEHRILERIVEPERVILFRVSWLDDRGDIHVNKGYRVEFNSALGPYMGGIRFHPTVNLGVFKFLGFEQIFRNALTTLPMGGGAGGSDFDPKGRSDNEVMRFCQSFMTELARHSGPNTDISAGDIGVGGREIGFLFGQYKRLRNTFNAGLADKGVKWGGTLLRPEATGFGAVYFAEEMLKTRGEALDGKRVAISGSGNVALHAAEKCLALGARVVALSDTSGFLRMEGGLRPEVWREIMDLKRVRRGRLSEIAGIHPDVAYHDGNGIWSVPCEVALPCATQNELGREEAAILLGNGCTCVCEGATMPSTPDAVDLFTGNKVFFAPGKAANAGGVAVSGLELCQNSRRLSWPREEVDLQLKEIIRRIHEACAASAAEYGQPGNYVAGAAIAGFVRVADAMIDQGVV